MLKGLARTLWPCLARALWLCLARTLSLCQARASLLCPPPHTHQPQKAWVAIVDGDVSQLAQAQPWQCPHSCNKGSQAWRELGLVTILHTPQIIYIRILPSARSSEVDWPLPGYCQPETISMIQCNPRMEQMRCSLCDSLGLIDLGHVCLTHCNKLNTGRMPAVLRNSAPLALCAGHAPRTLWASLHCSRTAHWSRNQMDSPQCMFFLYWVPPRILPLLVCTWLQVGNG